MKGKFTLFILALLCLFTNTIQAQVVRPYGLVFSDNLRGGHTMFGNTLMHSGDNAMNTFSINSTNGTVSSVGNDDYNMKHVQIDAGTTLINFGENWRYHNAANKPNGWPNVTTFNSSGNTPLYYDGDFFSSDNLTERTTHYFVKQVSVSNPNAFSEYQLEIEYESGFIIYINGVERARHNITGNNPAYNVVANSAERGTKTFTIPASAFVTGTNTIQVEMKNRSTSSSQDDTYFDLKLSNSLRNSSRANLVLPAGNNKIRYARLYWGGKVSRNSSLNNNDILKKAKIKFGNGAYNNVAATNIDKKDFSGYTVYQSYADITNFVNTNKAGTYSVGDIAATEGYLTFGVYAGWSIVVVYENTALPYHSVRLYDGFIEVYNGGSSTSQSVTLSNLDVPNNTLSLSDAWMSTMTWEGDGQLGADSKNSAGDYLKINNITYSDAVNHAKNMWNGTISKNGQHVTTKLPNYKNQMGIDIDEFEIGTGYGIQPNAKDLTVAFGTEADQYFPSVAAFSIRMKDPAITIEKSVEDINAGKLVKDDEIYYTLQGQNTGQGTAYDVVITDELPTEVTIVPGSIQIANGSTWITYNNFSITGTIIKTLKVFIGTGATTAAGGTLTAGQKYKVRFKCKVNQVATITNFASVTARNTPLGSVSFETFTDEASVEIGFDETPMPVTFAAFSGIMKNGLSTLNWTTATEENTSHFELERSADARNFRYVASVKAQGNSSIQHHYQQTDAGVDAVGMVYYRLKVVDIDGKITYSKIIALSVNSQLNGKAFTFFPNPVQGSQELKLQLNAAKEGTIQVRIVNSNGQVIALVRKPVQPGSNIIVLSEFAKALPGIYMVQVVSGSEQFAQSILKQ